MSRSMHIFLDANCDLATLAKEIGRLLQLQWERRVDPYETWYEYADETKGLTLGVHEFENDQDMNFEAYRYDIELRVFHWNDPEEYEQTLTGLANTIYQKLQSIQKYPLMLVDDLQVKLGEFSPRLVVPAVMPTTT